MIQPADGRPADVITSGGEDGWDQTIEAIRQRRMGKGGLDGGGGHRAQHNLVGLGQFRSMGHPLHRRAGQYVIETYRRITGAKTAAGAAANSNFEAQGGVAGHDRLHEGLHGDGSDDRPHGRVLPGKPGSQAIPAEAQDCAAIAAGSIDDPAEDIVNPLGEFLRAAFWPQGSREFLRQGGETADVGEERRAVRFCGQSAVSKQGKQPVDRQEGDQIVQERQSIQRVFVHEACCLLRTFGAQAG